MRIWLVRTTLIAGSALLALSIASSRWLPGEAGVGLPTGMTRYTTGKVAAVIAILAAVAALVSQVRATLRVPAIVLAAAAIGMGSWYVFAADVVHANDFVGPAYTLFVGALAIVIAGVVAIRDAS